LHTDLCPKKHTLEHNLRTHLVSVTHVEAVETKEAVAVLVTRTGKRGKPKKVDGRDLHPSQKLIHKFYKDDGSRAETSSGKGGLENLDFGLTLLCWGLWVDTEFERVLWKGLSYDIRGILDDQKGGNVWEIEATTSANVYNPDRDRIVNIGGCYRHKECSRLSVNGGGFADLTCSKCAEIASQDDFRGRVHREADSIVHRGERKTHDGMKLDYLTNLELKNQVHTLNAKHRKEHWLLVLQAQKVCALSTKKKSLEELLGVASDRKDLRLFLKSIVNGHQNSAFGGKEGLWDF
jgi:hypothetical protein